ncbi:putative immunoglobulin-blocking virulence protein [Mycoplasma struthionis]|uniref:putative immunoglobulin-blocking virulence protein n=1 Tax=Mycoplasma struthionis TaxID=538220 RepID=UPI001645ECB2|nr:putative immunoglobulin-blocking virulence protein [Mycoplasma struthionis]
MDINGDKKDDGIRVYEYKPDADNDTVKDKSERKYIAKLDATNKKGYDKFLKFIKENPTISGIIIENMGLVDKKQDFSQILSQIPPSIKTATLFFETNDTSSLVGLKDKHLKDIQIVTKGNNLDEAWGIDPIAFRHTDNVSFDYNVNKSPEYPSNSTPRASSIVFDTIRPAKTDSFSEIQEGFRLAYTTRKNWRIFNGSMGDGSWISRIDLSLHPELRGLKGLDLNDKVFNRLTLANSSNVFEVKASELVEQKWSRLIVKGPQKAELKFVSPVPVDTLYIKGLAKDLPNNYNAALYGLFEAGKKVFKKIYVDNEVMKETIQARQATSALGITVEVKPDNFNPSKPAEIQGPQFI